MFKIRVATNSSVASIDIRQVGAKYGTISVLKVGKRSSFVFIEAS